MTETREAGWRPIESAPKDGTEIMLWLNEDRVWRIAAFLDDAWRDPDLRDDFVGNFQFWAPLPTPPPEAPMTANRVRLTEAQAILARAHEAYVEALSAPLRGTIGTEADLRAANSEREDVARETMFDCLYDLQPAHVAVILAGITPAGRLALKED